jgi:hypothetical protein|nr:MAG TPA: hypothetical protein [Caudoviricetes sp.]
MKFEDLHDVEIGDILKCKDSDDSFEVIEIDMAAKYTPIRVQMTSGYSTTELVSGVLDSDRFDESYKQWLYVDSEAIRNQIPVYEDMIDASNLITLDRLEPLKLEESTESTEHEAHEALENLTANRAAEIVKGRLIREVLKRVRQAVYGELGTFEIKVKDLDLDPVTSDLEWLGYTVRFSMKDDEFTVSWEPKL